MPPQFRVEVIDGLAGVLARLPEIATLAATSGQQVEWAELPYLLSRPTRRRDRPTLLLLYNGQTGSIPAGAVVLYRFGSILASPKLYTGYSRRGLRTIFGPAALRVDMAAIAARSLLERGARFVNIQLYMGALEPNHAVRQIALARARAAVAAKLAGITGAQWALHAGSKHFELPIYSDLPQTLARLGSKTRKNFRRNQHLCVRELGCRFEPQAAVDRGYVSGTQPALQLYGQPPRGDLALRVAQANFQIPSSPACAMPTASGSRWSEGGAETAESPWTGR